MKLALSCRSPKLYSYRRLVEAAETHGHTMDVIDQLRSLIDVSSGQSKLIYKFHQFRSNLHRGGSAKSIKITPQKREKAVNSAKAMGLNVCGVDLLRSSREPVVMEVNSSAGPEDTDVAGKIIEFIEKNAKPGKTKTRGKG